MGSQYQVIIPWVNYYFTNRNPGKITFTQETLGFRRAGISPAYSLLMPAFSLLISPAFLIRTPSSTYRTLLYHQQ